MVRTLLGFVLVVVVLVAAAAFFFGYRWRADTREAVVDPAPAPVASEQVIDRDRAREAGAEIADKVAEAANRSEQVLANAALTTKIKSKMALDDSIDAGRINVDTQGPQVTLTGTVGSDVQRQRALQLARETDGVTAVVDRLVVAR